MSHTIGEASTRTQLGLFARNFLKHPKMLGSIIPSSRFLVGQLLDQIEWRRARVIVEYGAGVGTFTRELLARMPADGRLLVLETNADFVEFLRSSIQDSRLIVAQASAADVDAALRTHGLDRADYIISGIPFSTLPPDVRDAIIAATRDALKPDGRFLVYQFSARVLPHLRETFRHVQRGFQPLNILPARLFYCSK